MKQGGPIWGYGQPFIIIISQNPRGGKIQPRGEGGGGNGILCTVCLSSFVYNIYP